MIWLVPRTCLALFVLGLLFAASACSTTRETAAPTPSASCDRLLGWYALGTDTLIPVFKRDGAYFTVNKGAEAPLKENSGSLEWAFAPSNRIGTRIAFDEAANSPCIVIVDNPAAAPGAPPSTGGEKEPLRRIEEPSWLPDTKARRPRSLDGFVGWYQALWLPESRCRIRKDGDRYLIEAQVSTRPGHWLDTTEARKLTPLDDGSGLKIGDSGSSLVYNKTLKRFEIAMEGSHILRMPLARIPDPPSGGGDTLPQVTIGIPTSN